MSPDERLEKYVMDEDIVDIEDDPQVEASWYEDEVEVDDSLEEEGDDINNNTFPDCDRVDDVKDGGLDTNAAEGQKERENASNLPVDEDNVGGAEFGFDDIADFIGDIIGDKNIVQPAVSQERAVKKSRSVALSRYGTNVTPTQSNLEALCLEVNQFPPPTIEAKDDPVTKVFVDPTPKSRTVDKNGRSYLRFTLQDAWDSGLVGRLDQPLSHRSAKVKKFLAIRPTLTCGLCCYQGARSEYQLIVHEESYLNSICDNARMWWDVYFISSFMQLAAHYAHTVAQPVQQKLSRRKTKNKPTPPLPQVMHLTFPDEAITEERLISFPKNVEKIVAVVHQDEHYAVLEMDLPRT
jgi:hypothetical protein